MRMARALKVFKEQARACFIKVTCKSNAGRESEEREREPEQAEAHKVRRVKRNGFSTFLSLSLWQLLLMDRATHAGMPVPQLLHP